MSVEVLAPRAAAQSTRPERVLWCSFACTFVLKAVAAAVFPFTGDEAYFVQWGRELAGSYYDHGPVTGWLLWALLQVSDSVLWLRLPAILAPIVVAWVLWRAWRPLDPERAALGAALVAWSLPSSLSLLITTDTPMMVLGTLAVALAARAERSDNPLLYISAGALLGLAFLAKYFAVLLGLGMAVWWLGRAAHRRWHAVGWLLLGVAPFVAQHLYWNYHHSWTNVMFNVFTRQEGLRISPVYPLGFILASAWLFGPITLALWKNRGQRWREAIAVLSHSNAGLFWTCAVVGFSVLFVVSSLRSVGLHWLLAFCPLALVFAVAALTADQLRRLVRPVALFSVAHLAVGVAVALLPVEWGASHRSYVSIVMGVHPDEVLQAISPLRQADTLATPSYARSALLEYNAREPVLVLGGGSFHGRHDDLRTDWRTYEGRNITFVTANAVEAQRASEWFRQADVRAISVRGAHYHVVVGHGFDYSRYREEVLRPVAARYYDMPDFLDAFSSGCFFKKRYNLE